MTPVAILVRVSTLKQETDRQITELTAHATSQGYDVLEIVREDGVGGSARVRPGLERIVTLAREKRIRKVLVHEVTRVARKNSVAHKFLEDLTEAGVSLYWHAQRIETLLDDGRLNPVASIMFALLAEQARSERELLRERTISGLQEARRKGKTLGRPTGSTDDETVLRERHRDVVRWLNDGHSVRHTAAITGKSRSTVEKMRRVLKGVTPALDITSYEV